MTALTGEGSGRVMVRNLGVRTAALRELEKLKRVRLELRKGK